VAWVFGVDPRNFADAAQGFGHGFAAGAAKGAAILAKGVEAAAEQAYALATDSKARAAAGQRLVQGAEAVGTFSAGVIHDPGGAVSEAAGAVQRGASAVADAAEGAFGAYKTAAASGAGAEFLGEALGESAVLAVGAVAPGGGEAEAGVLAAEGTEALGAGAAELTESLAAGQGATLGTGSGAAEAGEAKAAEIELDRLAEGAMDERAMTVRQSPAEINAVIQKNLRSPEKGLRLEGEIGKLIADERFSVLSAGRQVGLNGSTGEIDLETDEAIIECYSASNGKLAQIKKLVRDAAMNPSGKPVVLYAPSYGGMAARDIVAAGAMVAKTPDELVAILKSLRGK